MTTPAFEKEYRANFDKNFFKRSIEAYTNPALAKFQKILKSYTFFNLFFILLIAFETIYLFVHLTLLVQSFVLAIHLALIFASIFCYFTLQVYAQTRKAERLIELKSEFLRKCRETIVPLEDDVETHQMIAEACCQLASELHAQEYSIYECPAYLSFLSSSVEKFNCWYFWKDVHFIKELLLQASVEEHIKLVQLEPTDPEAHAGLANAYVMLSGLYVDPREVEGLDDERWIPPHKYNEAFMLKFRSIAERAIEEFKILSDYAPHDPWVHTQLAYSYHDLQMPEQEIKEYETIIRLNPDDKEILFKLGKLYFQYGENAKGLQIYETLKHSNYKKAENLIHFYGAYSGSV